MAPNSTTSAPVSRTACLQAPAHLGRRPQERLGLSQYPVRRTSIEPGAVVVARTEHRDAVGRQLARRAPRACAGCPPRAAGSRSSRAGCGARPRRRYPARAMPPLTAPADELAALAQGRAALDLSGYRAVQVTGADARRWLHDLVTTDVASLRPGQARRSLLLDPTGHIRADLQVACADEGFWLFQEPEPAPTSAPRSPGTCSRPTSSCDDRSATRHLMALPGSDDAIEGFAPSITGPGVDVLLDGGSVPPLGRMLVGGRRGRGLAHPRRPGTDGRRLRRDLDPGRGRPRRDDRRREGVLPRTGIGGPRSQPRASTTGPAAPAM